MLNGTHEFSEVAYNQNSPDYKLEPLSFPRSGWPERRNLEMGGGKSARARLGSFSQTGQS